MKYDTGIEYIDVDGQIVEKDALLIAESIKEYDPNLEIICMDPNTSGLNDAPFIICERKPDGALTRIFECWELDSRVVERIKLADRHLFDPSARFDTIAQMQKRLTADRYKDREGEMADIFAHAMANKKSTFKVHNNEGDLIKIHDDRPVEKGGRTYTY